jgi:hypothetical protein
LIASAIYQTFGSVGTSALAIAKCESGLESSRIGDTTLEYTEGGELYGYSSGLFQIRHLPGRPDPISLLDPVKNIDYAHQLYIKEGWKPWTCAKILKIK